MDTLTGMDRENAFALAVAVMRERVQRLSKEDQDYLYELLPALLGNDDEERAAADRAISEIMEQRAGKVQRLDLPEQRSADLSNWVAFVSQRIRQAREQAGLTQDELAMKSGLDQSHISRLEQGQHSPTAKTLKKIADALGIDVGYFDPSA